jgi:hypothetical protein
MACGQTSEQTLLIVIDIVLGGDKDIHSLTLGKVRLQTQRWGSVNVALAAAMICTPLSVLVLILVLVLVQTLVLVLVLVPGSQAPLLVPKSVVEEG